MLKNDNYLEGLNTLRFIAATLVLVGHCNENLSGLGINWHSNCPILNKGSLAVGFFFVLSGFLLTDIAIKEYQQYGCINIKNFFLRRIFRILPLYYLAVLLAYLLLGVVYTVLSGSKYFSFSISEALPYHIFMLPNYVVAKWNGNLGSLYSLWSIGVEEQFYLVFPFFMQALLKSKNILFKIIIITIIFFWIYWLVSTRHFLFISETGVLFIRTLAFHCMLIGCTFSFLINNYKHYVSWLIENRVFQVLILIFFIVSLILPAKYDAYSIAHDIVFAFLILIVSAKKNRLLNIEIRPLVYLGSISYGIYIYHPLLSYPLRMIVEKLSFFRSVIIHFPAIYYLTELSLTIIIAHFSFTYFEKYFLSIRLKYMKRNSP